MFSESQYEIANRLVSDETAKADAEARRLALIGECLYHIRHNERPFKRTYITQDRHNGNDFEMTEIVWMRFKPIAGVDESFTLVDMPEYEEALRRLNTVPQ